MFTHSYLLPEDYCNDVQEVPFGAVCYVFSLYNFIPQINIHRKYKGFKMTTFQNGLF